MTAPNHDRYGTGAHVLMAPGHPHEGRTGTIVKQPSETGIGMYLIDFDDAYEGSAYADRRDLRPAPKEADR